MLKVFSFAKRQSALKPAEFQDFMLRHGRLGAKLPGLRGYTISLPLLSGYRRRELVYDAVSELWFDDCEAYRKACRSAAFAAAGADAETAIDLAASHVLLCKDVTIKAGEVAVGAVTNFLFIQRRPDFDVSAFQAYWRDTHGPIASRIPQVGRYVQSQVMPSIYARSAPRWDGVAITWFASVDEMRNSAASPEFADARRDEANFLRTGPDDMPFVITREHHVIPLGSRP